MRMVQLLPKLGFYRIRRTSLSKKELARFFADTHTEAAHKVASQLYNRQHALRMSSWAGRDGEFAALDETGKEQERFFVEAEDGTGKIRVPPSSPPSMTFEDAKRLKVRTCRFVEPVSQSKKKERKNHGTQARRRKAR